MKEISRGHYRRLLGLLTDMPLDMLVERSLWRDVPEHRPLQAEYHLERLASQGKGIPPTLPERWAPAYASMRIAEAVSLERLTDRQTHPHFEPESITELSGFFDATQRIADLDYASARTVTDAWANRLGMRDWYSWEPLHRG